MSAAPVWWEVRLVVPAALEDEAAGWLWSAGSRGQEILASPAPGDPRPGAEVEVEMAAFFETREDAEGLRRAVQEHARRGRAVRASAPRRRAEEDWHRGFREAAQPFALGRRLWIDPREPDAPAVAAPAGRTPLRIPARTAFGTGTHESTRLALELLEDAPLAGAAVLDVGTGTGILALAALRFGARLVIGFDIDPAAPAAARENARRNAVPGAAWYIGSSDALRPAPRFDLALLNVVPGEAAPLLADLRRALEPGAGLIASGVLGREAPAWLAALRAAGFECLGRREAGEWMACSLRRVA